ncbi:MAG: hypothetical protein Q8O03_09165, partial [Nanoarchaeota archaeon]|nr:hypothetical protein [Nanoarchaeota archaeon]
TYINVSITESHNDTVTIVWNYTTNYTTGIEDVTVTPAGGNIIFYEINITNLTDGVYEYYIFANDTLANESEGHHNISEVRTITIDETQPSTFDLLDPSNNVELTDDTPAFNWEDTTDINFDNYSLEVTTDGNFSTIDNTFTTTVVSYYALQDALGNGTFYWRVRATDKANNQRNSTSTFQFTIGDVSSPTQYVIGPGGGGGGGGGKKIVYGVVNIIQPSLQTLYEEETITTPVIIQNTGEGAIKGIVLKASTDSPAINLDLSKAYIEYLAPGQQESVDLKIIARGVVGEYEVTVKVEATEPKITDQAKFYVNLIGFGLGKKTIVEEKLRFVGKLFESNPECLELKEMVEEARKKLEEKDYDKSLEIIESAIKSCEELVKTSKKKVLEKPAEPKRTLQILIAEISAFILMFIMIYRYYRKRTYKGPVMARKGKPGITMILIILIFLSGFLFLKNYTGLTVFEDISASDFNLGTHANTTTSGNNVILTSGSTLGNFTSRAFNANFTVEWQTINWSWASTANDNITIDVRTSFDNITWSSWSENVTNTSEIPDAKNIWTDEEDFIGTLVDTNITNKTSSITLQTNCSGYSETGNFTSESLDLGFAGVNITTIEFTITNTSSEDNITIETSTSADNTTWEDWAQTNVSGDQVFSTDNKFFKWKATLITNDTEITPSLDDLTVYYKRNSTYLQYRATLSTNDTTLTPSLEWVNITYHDANYPIFEFLSPAANDSYTADNFTYINFTITEPNNDSFYLDWNGTTTHYLADMNETADVSEGVYSYGINMTELVEGIYEYHTWANDTYGHENQTENFTIIIDQTSPTAFNLLNPSDGNRSTDDTPFLLWEDTNETNLDNYTIQFATDTSTATYYNISSNYQIQDSEALTPNGTFYWHVIAYDKAGNSHTTSNFTYYLGYEQTTAFVPGTAGEGGGGGKRTERRQVGLELIKPSALSFFANREIIIPLLLSNTGTEILQNIELTAESADLELELKNNVFPVLRPNEEIDPQLVIKPVENPGRYNIIIKAKVTSPEFTDAIMFIVDIVEFGAGNRTEAEEKLTFVVDFIKSNDECAELEKYVIDAQEAFKKNEFDLVLSLTDQAMQSCKDLVSTAKEKQLEKKKRPTWQYYVPLLEVLLFLLIFSSIYSYYKRLKFKRRKYW